MKVCDEKNHGKSLTKVEALYTIRGGGVSDDMDTCEEHLNQTLKKAFLTRGEVVVRQN